MYLVTASPFDAVHDAFGSKLYQQLFAMDQPSWTMTSAISGDRIHGEYLENYISILKPLFSFIIRSEL
jgi:hypothetical protein